MGRIIDVHNHFYPEAYLREVARNSTAVQLVTSPTGETRVEYAGDYIVVFPTHRDPALRLAAMDEAGIDLQVLSLPLPGVHGETASRGIELAQLTNDAFAAITKAHPTRLAAFAVLPTQAPEAAARELTRAVRELGLVGGTLFSNLGGLPLDDSRFWPIYEAAEGLGVPLFIHPIMPAGATHFQDYRLVALLGFPFDMTLAAARLALGGVLDRFPRLQLIMSQLGGALPMLAERIERGYSSYPELRGTLQRTPLDYFREFYYDTVPYGQAGVPFTYAFCGPTRLLLGSDFPQVIGDLRSCTEVITTLHVPDAERAAMLGGNLEHLLRLPQG